MSEREIQKQINALYEANFSHFDFMDNMGGDCECDLHKEITNLCLSIGFDPRDND